MVGACQNAILSQIKWFMAGFLASLIEASNYFKYGIGYGRFYWISHIFKSSNHILPHKKSHGIGSRRPLVAKDIDHG